MATLKAPKIKPLKKLNVTVAPCEVEETEKSSVVVLKIGGEAVSLYNDASGQVKAWEKILKANRPAVENNGLTELYRYNTSTPADPVKTVKVVDSTGAACNVTVSDTYGSAKLDKTDTIKKLVILGKTDPNVFVAERLAIAFDASVFTDDKGELRQDFYEEVINSMISISSKYGAKCPMSSKAVVSPVPGFAEKRWQEFSVDQQPLVSAVFPATVTLKPVVEVKKAE